MESGRFRARRAAAMTERPLMIDLFSGTGGASAPFEARGWEVVRVELDESFPADHRDVRTFNWTGRRPDFVWASPPCTEFSRESMPWCARGEVPSFAMVAESLRIIAETRPRWWAIENVRGAVPWFEPVLGRPRAVCGPFHLWGKIPPFKPRAFTHKKSSLSGSDKAGRAAVPHEIGTALVRAIESQAVLA